MADLHGSCLSKVMEVSVTDMPRFQPPIGNFEHSYYRGGGLVGAVLRWVNRRRASRPGHVGAETHSGSGRARDPAHPESAQVSTVGPHTLVNASSR